MRTPREQPERKNLDIRVAILEANVWYKTVADAPGVPAWAFSRMLRVELPPDEKAVILNAIKALRGEKSIEL